MNIDAKMFDKTAANSIQQYVKKELHTKNKWYLKLIKHFKISQCNLPHK